MWPCVSLRVLARQRFTRQHAHSQACGVPYPSVPTGWALLCCPRCCCVQALALRTDSAEYGGLVCEGGAINASAVDCIFNEFDVDK